MIHHVKRATRFFIFWSLISGAVLLTLIRFIFHQIENYKAELESVISAMVEAPCKIGKIRVNIYGLTPKLLLSDIDILQQDSDSSAIQLKEIRLSANLWNALLHWDFYSSTKVTLVGAKLSVKRKPDGGISVVGLKSSDDRPLWLLQGGRYEMLHSEVIWQDEKRHAAIQHFSHVDIFINNQLPEQQHQLNISMRLPEDFGESLQLSLLLKGNIFQTQSLNGRLYARGNKIRLAEIASGDLPMGMVVKSGIASFELWSDWANSRMTDLVGVVEAKKTDIHLRDKPGWLLQKIAARFHWTRKQHKWRLAFKDVFLDSGRIQWQEHDFSLWGQGLEQAPLQKFAAGIRHMDLAMLSKLLIDSKLLQDEYRDKLQQLSAKGTVNNLSVFVDRENQHIAINGSFNNIGFSALDSIPKIENISGVIYGSDQQGYLQIAARDAAIVLPDLFSDPLKFEKLQGRLHWRQYLENWTLASSMIELDLQGIQTRNRIELQIPKLAGNKTFMDLQSAIDNVADVRQLKSYLPTVVMDKDLADWLNSALLSGEVISGSALFYGHLADYPFVEKQGVFEGLLDLRGVGLAFDAQWPYVTDIDAEVLCYQNNLQVDIAHGRVNGATIEYASGTIPSISNSDYLQLKGRVTGTIGQSIGFFQQSPLAPKVRPVLESIALEGNNVIDVQLQLPLNLELPVKLEGTARLDKTQLIVRRGDIPVQNLTGDLHFNEQGIYSDNLQAMALGYPIQIQIRDFPDSSIVELSGKSDIEHLRQAIDTPLWDYAEGGFDYNLLLTIPVAEQQPATLQLSSELTGLIFDLPEPLAKTADQPAPLTAKLNFTDSKLMPMTWDYAGHLKAALEFDSEQQLLYSGHVLLGKGHPDFLHQQGIKLEINSERFALAPWLALKYTQQQHSQHAATELNEITLNTPHFNWEGQDYGHVELQLSRENQQWQGNFSSQFASGKIDYREQSGKDAKVNLDLHYINLDNLISLQAGYSEISPLDFPLIKINSRQLLWRSVNLGALAIDMERLVDGLIFKRFMVKQKERSLSFFGSTWKMKDGQSITDATGTLEMDDLGVFLSELDITYDMKGTDVKIDFSSYWHGAPFQISLAALQAQLEVKMGEGRFLGVEPGIGRILGVLDLGRLLQRLQLDFTDVYAEGLSYDSIRGSFRLADGYAKTDNLVIDAVPAIIKISGSTGLVTRDYDQIITVIPKTSVAIPIAGTIVKGVAALVAKTVTGKPGDGFFISSQYALKGKWGDAEIIPLHENDGLLQKAWLGITDFSWLGTKKEIIEREHE